MRNLIKFENFSMNNNNMVSREEMTKMLCNNGYSVEECNDLSYAEICKACDGCKDMEMAQTYEARKSTKTTAAKKKYSQGKKLTKDEMAALEKPYNKVTKGDIVYMRQNSEKSEDKVQTFSQAQKAQAQKPKAQAQKAQAQKPKTTKTAKKK